MAGRPDPADAPGGVSDDTEIDLENQEADDESPEDQGGEDEADEADVDADDGGDADADAEEETRHVNRRSRPGRAERAETQLRDLRGSVERLERELEASRRQPTPPPVDPMARQREVEAENALLAGMGPEEQGRYWFQKGQEETRRMVAQTQFQTADAQDKRDFAQLQREFPGAAQYAAEVERTLEAARSRGRWALTREDIFNSLYGKAGRERTARQAPRQRADARRRVASQTTRPGSGRGDVARGGGGRSQEDQDLRFLRNTRVGDVV